MQVLGVAAAPQARDRRGILLLNAASVRFPVRGSGGGGRQVTEVGGGVGGGSFPLHLEGLRGNRGGMQGTFTSAWL